MLNKAMSKKDGVFHAWLIVLGCFVSGTGQAQPESPPSDGAFVSGTIDARANMDFGGVNEYHDLRMQFGLIKYRVKRQIVNNKKIRVITGSGDVVVRYSARGSNVQGTFCQWAGEYLGSIEVTGKVQKKRNGELIANVRFTQTPHIGITTALCNDGDGGFFEIPVQEAYLGVPLLIRNVTVKCGPLGPCPLVPERLISRKHLYDPKKVWKTFLITDIDLNP